MISRRHFCAVGALAAFLPAPIVRASVAHHQGLGAQNFPLLRQRAFAALEQHEALITQRDAIGIVDFSLPSRQPRFHILDLVSGQNETLLVAHGKGSDPDHSGWLESFSNEPGSEASSAGAYLTGDLYVGKHGRSRRLIGLEPSNNNAEARAIVIHGAWYAAPELAQEKGKLGRSQGCLAVAESDIEEVLARLGNGRLIYVDKV